MSPYLIYISVVIFSPFLLNIPNSESEDNAYQAVKIFENRVEKVTVSSSLYRNNVCKIFQVISKTVSDKSFDHLCSDIIQSKP